MTFDAASLFKDIAVTDLVQAIVVCVGVVVTVATYRRNSKLQRAEWIYRLYTQFYEGDRFKPIRRVIDYEKKEELAQLEADLATDVDSDLHESFVDYLNFFEFICIQIKDGTVRRREVYDMFEYYLGRMNDYPFVVGYAEEFGYENLAAELTRLRTKK